MKLLVGNLLLAGERNDKEETTTTKKMKMKMINGLFGALLIANASAASVILDAAEFSLDQGITDDPPFLRETKIWELEQFFLGNDLSLEGAQWVISTNVEPQNLENAILSGSLELAQLFNGIGDFEGALLASNVFLERTESGSLTGNILYEPDTLQEMENQLKTGAPTWMVLAEAGIVPNEINSVALRLYTIPEPSALALVALSSLTLLRRRR